MATEIVVSIIGGCFLVLVALIDLLTPFSENSGSIPTVPAAFGGVGYQPFVTTWTPIPMDDADNSCGVLITFTVRSTVWQ